MLMVMVMMIAVMVAMMTIKNVIVTMVMFMYVKKVTVVEIMRMLGMMTIEQQRWKDLNYAISRSVMNIKAQYGKVVRELHKNNL